MPTEPIAEAHHKLVRDVSGLRLDRASAGQIDALGLHLTHVSWEDTARFKDSAVGPNISDMTIEVESRRQGQRFATCRARERRAADPGPAEAGSAAAGAS